MFGAGAVGKSALVIKFVKGDFILDYDPTIEDIYDHHINVDGELVNLKILDTAGQEDFKPMRTTYMRQGQGFIIVYAIDDRQSFDEVEFFYHDIKRTRMGEKVPLILCCNKCDLENRRVVSKTEGKALASEIDATFFETSVLSNHNVEEIFREISRQMLNRMTKKPDDRTNETKKTRKNHGCNII